MIVKRMMIVCGMNYWEVMEKRGQGLLVVDEIDNRIVC